MSMNINADETEINGSWVISPEGVETDEAAKRIDALTNGYLAEVARSHDGWSVLYRDPNDGRYWELTYPESVNHGGGAPRLMAVSVNVARTRYRQNAV